MKKYEKSEPKADLFKEEEVRKNTGGNENLVKFAYRLCLLLDEKGLNESELVREINKDEEDKDGTIRKKSKESKISKASLNAYLKGEQKPSVEKLINIANYFKVSTDYLLGISNLQSLDENMKKVNSITGLSDEAIKVLKVLKDIKTKAKGSNGIFEQQLEAINYLIENELEYFIFGNMASFFWHKYETPTNTVNVLEKNSGVTMQFSTTQLNNIAILELEKQLNELKKQANKIKRC